MNRRMIAACVMLLTALPCGLGLAAESAPLRIKGSNGELIVDAKGISLAPSNASCPTVTTKNMPMWAVLLQKAGKPPVKGAPVVLEDRKQTVKRETGPDSIRLIYESLTDGKQTWQVSLTLDIHRRGDAFEVTGEIKNNEPAWIVCGFTGPVLDGIQADLATHPLLLADGFGRRVNRVPDEKGKAAPWHSAGKRFEVATHYPSRSGTMQWCTLAGEQGGLYLGCHDAAHGAKDFCVRFDPTDKQFGFAIKHRFFRAAGKSWSLPPTIFLPYEGTWHTAAHYYRDWIDAATPVLKTPAWTQNASGWLLCILKQQNGEVLWDYPSLEQLADVADQRGLDILGLFGWAHGGHDHLYPDYFPDPKMGGEAALRKALKEVHRHGKRAIIYANGQLEERDTEFWKTQGKDLAVIKRDGVSVQETWHKYRNAPSYHFDVACLATQGWYDRMLALAIQANNLGADGILYDQLGVVGPKACYATGHEHPIPSTVCTNDRTQFLQRIADHMKTINPDFIVMTEGLHDSIANSISLFHGCVLGVFGTSSGDIMTRLHRSSVSSPFPEMFRYTFPEVMSTMRNPTPMINRVGTNYACVYGFRHEIESRYAPDVRYLKEDKVPEASEYREVLSPPNIGMMQATSPEEANAYLKRVVEFQRKNADLLWRGRFVDDQGFAFSGENLIAKAYVAGNRTGVLVWNPSNQSATFTLSVPHAKLVSASEPENDNPQAFAALAPQTVRLLVWEKP